MLSRFNARRTASAAVLVTPVVLIACGARGPLDLGAGGASADLDGAVDVGVSADAAGDQSEGADGATDRDGGRRDGGREGGFPGLGDAGGLLGCGACVAQSCGMQVVGCISQPQCQMALQCAVTKCLAGGGGGLNPQCIFGCTNGNPQALQSLIGIFTCIATKCGSQCAGLAGGLGGGGTPGGGGFVPDVQPDLACEAFSSWDVCAE
jgi:hypothetical protein